MVDFSNSKYIRVYGKNPRGEGQWYFMLGNNGRMIPWYGSLSEAKKAVKKRARELGFEGTIYVLP